MATKNTVETAQEATQIKVFRKITDSIPLTVHSRFRLQISGKAREISIARALLPQMTAQEIISALPARIDQDGNLIVQARPGAWDISVIAYHSGIVSQLTLPKLANQKPETTDKAAGTVLNTSALFDTEEIWVFEASPLLRTTTIEGANTVDVSQTLLPDEWRNLPAYLMNQTTQFGIKQIRRGDSDPAPNKLALERKIWLSFDGQSMTVNDRMHGTMNRPERLNLHSEGNLGRVDVSGVAQQISVDTQQRAGIELQRGPLILTADSFIKKAGAEFSAVGWQQDFDQLSVQLQLPPGWQLLYAAGADKADGAWLTHWNLLDFL